MKISQTSIFDRFVLGVIAALFVVGGIAHFAVDGKKSKNASTTSTTTSVADSTTTSVPGETTTTSSGETTTTYPFDSRIKPFTAVTFKINGGDEKCALLAETQDALERGMMGLSTPAPYDAMIFKFADDTKSSFWNKGVPVALSIAWYDKDGNYVDQTNMDVCPASVSDCPHYGAAGKAYRYAIEVPKGGFGSLKIKDGSSISFGGGCTRG